MAKNYERCNPRSTAGSSDETVVSTSQELPSTCDSMTMWKGWPQTPSSSAADMPDHLQHPKSISSAYQHELLACWLMSGFQPSSSGPGLDGEPEGMTMYADDQDFSRLNISSSGQSEAAQDEITDGGQQLFLQNCGSSMQTDCSEMSSHLANASEMSTDHGSHGRDVSQHRDVSLTDVSHVRDVSQQREDSMTVALQGLSDVSQMRDHHLEAALYNVKTSGPMTPMATIGRLASDRSLHEHGGKVGDIQSSHSCQQILSQPTSNSSSRASSSSTPGGLSPYGQMMQDLVGQFDSTSWSSSSGVANGAQQTSNGHDKDVSYDHSRVGSLHDHSKPKDGSNNIVGVLQGNAAIDITDQIYAELHGLLQARNHPTSNPADHHQNHQMVLTNASGHRQNYDTTVVNLSNSDPSHAMVIGNASEHHQNHPIAISCTSEHRQTHKMTTSSTSDHPQNHQNHPTIITSSADQHQDHQTVNWPQFAIDSSAVAAPHQGDFSIQEVDQTLFSPEEFGSGPSSAHPPHVSQASQSQSPAQAGPSASKGDDMSTSSTGTAVSTVHNLTNMAHAYGCGDVEGASELSRKRLQSRGEQVGESSSSVNTAAEESVKRSCIEHQRNFWQLQSQAHLLFRGVSDSFLLGSPSGSSGGSLDMSSVVGPALNTNGRPRARRGSATDPQSVYARHRRERINDRLKILQHLVPNGAKVDIVTMLEEAIHYVKFLQLQVRFLSSDELWIHAPTTYNGMDANSGMHPGFFNQQAQ